MTEGLKVIYVINFLHFIVAVKYGNMNQVGVSSNPIIVLKTCWNPCDTAASTLCLVNEYTAALTPKVFQHEHTHKYKHTGTHTHKAVFFTDDKCSVCA